MRLSTIWAAPLIAVAIGAAQPILAAPVNATAPALFDPAALKAMAVEGARYPLFADQLARARKEVDAAMRAGINVPVPKDPAGGFTHTQHKHNYMTLYNAGLLYRITGERKYAEFARDMLLQYAKLYPTLGPHPAAKNSQEAGRLFWQVLNDSVWLVYSIQGYDAIRDTLSDADRQNIDTNVFRAMAKFLTTDASSTFNLIHNHATWACAGVGMTGYVLRDPNLVEMALKGTDKSGKSGFLRQIDLLFSPDGYYTEGPYYERYAIQPFVVFAHAIQRNDPGLHIFQYRDGVLLKAIKTTIQLTYDGYFFPFNDSLLDKSLRTPELYQAVATAYAQTRDPDLLSIAKWQGHTALTPDGLAVARDLAAGKAEPFPYASELFLDGPNGKKGGIAVMRSDASDTAEVLAAKNTDMGMGHGHFDKLTWILYDNGHPIITDYGSARFLNIESKDGGIYLKENTTWAKQTVAHNTLVVNETSNFNGNWHEGEKLWPKQLYFSGKGPTKVSTAEMTGAWPGVTFRRTLIQLQLDNKNHPVVVDLLRVHSDKPATYDLPLHYSGHIVDLGFKLKSNVTDRPVLGTANGYQHIWVDGTAPLDPGNAWVTWLNDGRFYTYRMLPPTGAKVILGESGANDPNFNLRREPMLIERVTGAKDATFVAFLEPHGLTDPSNETTVGSNSTIAALHHVRTADADLVTLDLVKGGSVTLAVADSVDADMQHHATIDSHALDWKGHFARFDNGAIQ